MRLCLPSSKSAGPALPLSESAGSPPVRLCLPLSESARLCLPLSESAGASVQAEPAPSRPAETHSPFCGKRPASEFRRCVCACPQALGANGIVGAAMPLCTGAALAAKIKGSGQVAVAFFGDGASNQGVFHESLNLASVWKLPVVFFCENNLYALTTPYQVIDAVERIADARRPTECPAFASTAMMRPKSTRRARSVSSRTRGQGPSLIEALTYRWGQHSMRANLATLGLARIRCLEGP